MSNLNNFNGGFAKFLKEEWLVDVELRGDESLDAESILAHKLVLAARSNLFKRKFESWKVEDNGKVKTLIVPGMNQEELEVFVEFLYSSGSISAEKLEKHVELLYWVAEKYEIPHLRDICRNELIRTLHTSNALDVLELAQTPFDQVLNDAAFDFISKNIRTISSSDEFNLFVGRQPELTVKIMKAAFELKKN